VVPRPRVVVPALPCIAWRHARPMPAPRQACSRACTGGPREPWDVGRFAKTLLFFNEPPNPLNVFKSIASLLQGDASRAQAGPWGGQPRTRRGCTPPRVPTCTHPPGMKIQLPAPTDTAWNACALLARRPQQPATW